MTFSTGTCTEFFPSLLPDVQRQAESQEGTFVRVHLLIHKSILQIKKINKIILWNTFYSPLKRIFTFLLETCELSIAMQYIASLFWVVPNTERQ